MSILMSGAALVFVFRPTAICRSAFVGHLCATPALQSLPIAAANIDNVQATDGLYTFKLQANQPTGYVFVSLPRSVAAFTQSRLTNMPFNGQHSARKCGLPMHGLSRDQEHNVLDVVLRDLIRYRKSSIESKIVVDSGNWANYAPSDARIVVGNLNPVWNDMAKAREQSDYEVELDTPDGTYFSVAFQRRFPCCATYVYIDRPGLSSANEAMVQLKWGPLSHGGGNTTYVLRRRMKCWTIVKRSMNINL